jgi:hypothetical protein
MKQVNKWFQDHRTAEKENGQTPTEKENSETTIQ